MKTTISKTHYIAAAVISGAFAAGFMTGPAFADEVKVKTDAFAFQFSYEPAELGSAQSATKLISRLEGKVKKFCTNPVMTGTRMRNVDQTCVTRTMQETVAGFNSSLVAEVYKGRADG